MHQTCKDFIFSAQGAVIIVSKMIRQIYINYNMFKIQAVFGKLLGQYKQRAHIKIIHTKIS